MDEFSEVELKFRANSAHIGSKAREEFLAMCMSEFPIRYRYAQGVDWYYRQGVNVVRHRHSDGVSQLTVKQRKSATSIEDRVEVDLNLGEGVTKSTAEAFLKVSGFEKEITLAKCSHIFEYHLNEFGFGKDANVVVALYDVQELKGDKLSKPETYIEVEVDRGSRCNLETAKRFLKEWQIRLTSRFAVVGPLNESLYEIYTSNTYTMENKT